MANKIKIKINDPNSKTRINLPAIPLWLVNGLLSLGLSVKDIWLKFDNKIDDKNLKYLEVIDTSTIKLLFKELRREFKNYKPFDLINISKADGSEVRISLL